MEKKLSQRTTDIKKIAFVGPECTGKTTLCTHLAKHFRTQWTPEYMRTYLQKKWDQTRQVCQWEDLLPIAIGQIQSENQIAITANQYLFCDTNLLEIAIYSHIYYGKCPEQIENYAQNNSYDLIFLTDIDVPWQPDDLRDRPHQRQQIYNFFAEYLSKNNIKFIPLRGSLQERMNKVIAHISKEF